MRMFSVKSFQPFYSEQRDRVAQTHLVPQTLASNDGDLIANTLIGLEVQGQFWVVTFNYDFGRFLDGLRTNATLIKQHN